MFYYHLNQNTGCKVKFVVNIIVDKVSSHFMCPGFTPGLPHW